MLHDNPAFELHGLGQHPVFQGERIRQEKVFPRDLVAAVFFLQGIVDFTRNHLLYIFPCYKRLHIRRQVVLLRVDLKGNEVRHDHADIVFPAGAVDQSALDIMVKADVLLQGCREDILAVLQFELFLDAARDPQEAVLVEASTITCPEAAVGRHDLLRRVGFVVVTLHDVGPVADDFTVLCSRLHNRLVDDNLDLVHGGPDASDSEFPEAVHGDARHCFR